MGMIIARHGCLLFFATVTTVRAADVPHQDAIARIQTRRFEIEYHVNEEALPLTRVELWYSTDRGQTWHNFGVDQDNQSPIQFDAAEEGLYGFYFIVANSFGTSATPPQPESVPQQWTFVDYTPPVVQVRPVSVEREGSQRVVRIRWTALDAQFDSRPIQLAYRFAPDGEWRQIGEAIANAGIYDWRAPDDLEGRIIVRVTACDRGGNRIEASAPAVDLVNIAKTVPPVVVPVAAAAGSTATTAPSVVEVSRADRVFRRGVGHKHRGEYRLAVSRFRDALVINPGMTEVLVSLGEALYFQQQYSESIQAYRLAVEQEPGWLEARRGLARSLIGAREYDGAAAELARVLDADPKNAEAWLDQGDVSLWRGDEALARESWRRAATLEGRPDDVAERALARLSDVHRLSPWDSGGKQP